MAHAKTEKKPVLKTCVFGALTAAVYLAVFTHADALTGYFARGSLWAAGPVATVFLVSYLHGAFAHNLWALLGITANRSAVRPIAEKAVRPTPRAQPRATLST